MEKMLESLGLTFTESKVYLALLRRGSSPVGRLAKETGIHRRTVYDAVERLIEKGMISYITQNNKRFFEAVNPERLLDILKEKEDYLSKNLPELVSLYKSNKDKKETLFFRGKQGVNYIFEDMVKYKKVILQVGKIKLDNETINLYYKRFINQLKYNKIKIKVINVNKIKNLENSNVTIYVYDSNSAIIVWNNDPFAILIRQKEIADNYRILFNSL